MSDKYSLETKEKLTGYDLLSNLTLKRLHTTGGIKEDSHGL